MGKVLQQIVATCEGWEAVFFSYDDGELFREPVVCWAFMTETPYVHNGVEVERYLEGMVANGGSKIGGINDTPDDIAFVGYLYAKVPRKKIKERMDYFKDQARQLMEIRKSGYRLAKKIRGAQKRRKAKSGRIQRAVA